MNEVVDTAVREWLDLQGAARLQKEADGRYVEGCITEGNAKTAKTQKGKRAGKSKLAVVSRKKQ